MSDHLPDLPAAWRAATAFCPYCSGAGGEAERVCSYCGGTGDLFGAMLREAFQFGRDSVLSKLGEVSRVASLALQRGEEMAVPTADLKRAVGL